MLQGMSVAKPNLLVPGQGLDYLYPPAAALAASCSRLVR